jgi:ankyrin repeat protein
MRRRLIPISHETDDRGWTSLHIEARRGDLKQVRWLLNMGADVNVPAFGPKSLGANPLHLAAAGGHLNFFIIIFL